jgi:hypothetical protein
MRSRLSLFCAACLVLVLSLMLPAATRGQSQSPTPPPKPTPAPVVTVEQSVQVTGATIVPANGSLNPAIKNNGLTIVSAVAPKATPGSLLCSAAVGVSCGTTKADYVGAYKLNMSCPSGFYDPIYGGTCWKCPADTDGKGGWIRSATAITKDDACWRIPKESVAVATKVKKTAWAWECPSGSFWDGYDWGGCWTCPAAHPRRTAAPVYAANACASPVNETRPAVFLTFNGCPKPVAETMKLKDKRLPGKPFLDIAGGWNQGVASGGCYACPITDEEGNILVTQRNAAPIYGENKGCDILFKWKPGYFPEPGLLGLAGMSSFIAESKLLDSEKVTAGLYFQAESRGMKIGSPEAKEWVAKQWQQIAGVPYENEAFRTLVYQNLLLVATLAPEERTPTQTKLLNAFQEHIRQRRIYIARMGLDMYDAWKAHDIKAKQSVRQSSLQVAFDYGTVPLDFHATLGAAMSLGGASVGVAGATMAGLAYSNQLSLGAGISKNVAPAIGGDPVSQAANLMSKINIKGDTQFVSLMKSSDVFRLADKSVKFKDLSTVLKPLNIFKGTAAANAALAGSTVIAAAFAIIQSVAIDQFIEIVSARPKLEAALAVAQQPITVNDILAQPNGSDVLLYHWAKTMETQLKLQDPQVMAWAAAAHQQAQANGYKLAGLQ